MLIHPTAADPPSVRASRLATASTEAHDDGRHLTHAIVRGLAVAATAATLAAWVLL
jgi:hypothetical protein